MSNVNRFLIQRVRQRQSVGDTSLKIYMEACLANRRPRPILLDYRVTIRMEHQCTIGTWAKSQGSKKSKAQRTCLWCAQNRITWLVRKDISPRSSSTGPSKKNPWRQVASFVQWVETTIWMPSWLLSLLTNSGLLESTFATGGGGFTAWACRANINGRKASGARLWTARLTGLGSRYTTRHYKKKKHERAAKVYLVASKPSSPVSNNFLPSSGQPASAPLGHSHPPRSNGCRFHVPGSCSAC